MARKKITFDEPISFEEPIKEVPFKEVDRRMITNEKIYAEDSKTSLIIGVAMAGEVVRVLEPSISSDHMTKIRTYSTNRTGYVNPKSLL